MYVCILDSAGAVVVHRNMPSTPAALLEVLEPYRPDVVVAVECTFSWYWVADLCGAEEIAFVLGHAAEMKAVTGAKTKNDRIDSYRIASILRGGNLPFGYVYPRRMRATRDLLRRRALLVRRRAELLAHVVNTNSQYNLPVLSKKLSYPSNRDGVADRFDDPAVNKTVAVDLAVAGFLDAQIADVERLILRHAADHDHETFLRLDTVPGIGKVLALTILYEVGDVRRFPRVQDFVSYARLIRPERSSSGKRLGVGHGKQGNVHLKWAFGEAAALFGRHDDAAKTYYERLKRKHGQGRCLSVLAHKLGRAVYWMLRNGEAFRHEKMMAT
jgi:transposase